MGLESLRCFGLVVLSSCSPPEGYGRRTHSTNTLQRRTHNDIMSIVCIHIYIYIYEDRPKKNHGFLL